MRVLLVNPPLSNPEAPYPAICYLAGFLKTLGRHADLADASLLLVRRLFSARGLQELRDEIQRLIDQGACTPTAAISAFLRDAPHYIRTIDSAVAAVEGDDKGAVLRVLRPGYLPAPLDAPAHWAQTVYRNLHFHEQRLGSLTDPQKQRLSQPGGTLNSSFGALGSDEEARFRASTMLGDVASVVRAAIDPSFELNTYAESIVHDAGTFEPLRLRLEGPPNLLDRWVDELTDEFWTTYRPDLVGLSVPFPGGLVGALRIARRFKALAPTIRIVMGGGWVNTVLRELSDPGVFDYVDYITLDDGERPLQCIIETLEGTRSEEALLRTFVRRDGRVVLCSDPRESDVPWSATGTPTYAGLPLAKYLRCRTTLQVHNPWNVRWNKLTLAHGCYWKKCAFCDVNLDYINRYEPSTIDQTIEHIRTLIAETGESGFHFVDEAMPPALLKRLAQRLLADELSITWWGNVRFDESLAPIAPLLAESGCVKLTGGLEVASDRLLERMAKGVSLSQVARVTSALSKAGIQVHAYLIYGFPTQTAQETIDALEYVRQLLRGRHISTVFWHRFSLTAHSPIAADPASYGVTIVPQPPRTFGNYVLSYSEPGGIDHRRFKRGLNRATDSFMHGFGFEQPLSSWFDFDVPATTLPQDFVERFVSEDSCSQRHRRPSPPLPSSKVGHAQRQER